MNLQVENKQITVGDVRIIAVASSSLFLIGDTSCITLSTVFDTPPESVIVGPLVPLTAGR